MSRQIEAAEQYAAARGWHVVATYKDDGRERDPQQAQGAEWGSALFDSPETFDAVIVWEADQLARRVLDFLHADETLQECGAGIVAVEDPIDMTTPQGRAFAIMLSVFGEMEAAAISARVKSARNHLMRSGRVVGGKLPYG